MSEVDLDIENYELEDILNLFRLQYLIESYLTFKALK